jgi:hypothetical protein
MNKTPQLLSDFLPTFFRMRIFSLQDGSSHPVYVFFFITSVIQDKFLTPTPIL